MNIPLRFPDDPVTFDIDEQLLWGPALMIAPILYEVCTFFFKLIRNLRGRVLYHSNFLSI